MRSPSCSQIISRLNLDGHQEGGYYVQTSRDDAIVLSMSHRPSRETTPLATKKADKVDRSVSSSVYSLLPSGSVTHLYRLLCAETLHFCLGEPLTVGSFHSLTVEVHAVDGSAGLSSCVDKKFQLRVVQRMKSVVFELYEDGNFKLTSVGSDLLGEDQQPQYMVPPYVWFRLYPTNDYAISIDGAVKVHKSEPRDAENRYSFLGATCIPAFQIEDAEVAKRAEFVS